MNPTKIRSMTAWLLTVAICLAAPAASADAVTDWNIQAGQIVTKGITGTPPANRAMALVQTTVYYAVTHLDPGASAEAAIAAANRDALTALVPAQKEAIAKAYDAALAAIPDGPGKNSGVAAGEKAATAVFAARANDSAMGAESYRPYTTAGNYVPTTLPVALLWPQRKPWLMTSPSQFRPGPPPALTSETWVRDFNEVKPLGARNGSTRTEEQTAIAHFWEVTLPPVYHGVVRSVANQPGRDIVRNARLFATVTQAADDATIAVFDAKYAYGFWRPITAIRNADMDGNDATTRDAGWLPLIDTPMHPEYPCAHCILAATIATVLMNEVGQGPMPVLTTTSDTPGAPTRSWTTAEDLIREVSLARIYDGVHYRNSTEVGTAMGRKIGALAAKGPALPP